MNPDGTLNVKVTRNSSFHLPSHSFLTRNYSHTLLFFDNSQRPPLPLPRRPRNLSHRPTPPVSLVVKKLSISAKSQRKHLLKKRLAIRNPPLGRRQRTQRFLRLKKCRQRRPRQRRQPRVRLVKVPLPRDRQPQESSNFKESCHFQKGGQSKKQSPKEGRHFKESSSLKDNTKKSPSKKAPTKKDVSANTKSTVKQPPAKPQG
ncbi:hypothetical protein BC829DRAFT_168339 [Chytridium lagenaria]|nr:hypothetical protein BC829DRAFT_168339 [Chytridium lagenaria]